MQQHFRRKGSGLDAQIVKAIIHLPKQNKVMHLNLLFKVPKDFVDKYGSFNKTLMIMKISTILLFLCMHVYAGGSAQNVSLSLRNASFKELFKQVHRQTGYEFLYNSQMLEKTTKVSIDVKNTPLLTVLDQCFKNQSIAYQITDKTIVLKLKPVVSQKTIEPISLPVVDAQPPIKITGKVTMKDGTTLPGVTILIKGKTKGTVTDSKGEYSLQIAEGDKVLLFSCIGMKRQEIAINGRIVINVVMEEELSKISEVVVTGLFSRPKENYTGTARSFDQQELKMVSNSNLFNALKSLDPSLQVPQDLNLGSNPNALPQVVLRGGNSIIDPNGTGTNIYGYSNSPNSPLFILDGVEVSAQRIFDLDPNRVQSVSLLKDATATAIYGSRAANGVIVVESVPPTAGRLRVSYTGSATLEFADLKGYDLLKAKEKLALDQQINPPINNPFYKEQRALILNFRQGEIARGVETDWMRQPLQNAIGQKHDLYIEGGDKVMTYALTGSFSRRNGVMKESGRDVSTIGMQLTYRVKNLLFRNEINLNFNKSTNSSYGSFSDYVKMNPYWAPRDENGNIPYYLEYIKDWNGTLISQQTNPLYNSTLNIVDQSTYQNFVDNFFMQWNATDWLKVSARFAYQKQQNESDKFLPAQHTSFAGIGNDRYYEKGTYDKGYGRNAIEEGTFSVDMNKRFGNNVIYSSFGSTLRENQSSTEGYRVQGFPNDRLDDLLMGNRYPDGAKPSGSESTQRLAGYYANVSYSYNNRYLLDGSYRLDGSSLFGSDRRFASFWSLGTGWNVHNEAFLAKVDWINRLKLRYSLGYTGSQNFESYLGLTTSKYYTDQDYRYNLGTYILGYGNSQLSWQKTYKNNLGIDITAFKQYFDASFNVFTEISEGSLATVSTAPSTGFLSYKDNLGDVSNDGWELNARITLLKKAQNRDNISVFFNAFHVKGVIKKISNQLEQLNKQNASALSKTPLPRYENGRSMTAIWAVPSLGIDPASGYEIYLKRDGTTTTNYDPADQVVIADSRPKVEGTFGANVEIKGIGANVYLRYRYGGYAYNQTLVTRVEDADMAFNVDRRVYEQRWTKQGDVTFFKGKNDTQPTYASSRFVQKDNLLSMENVSLYYRLPQKVNQKYHLENTMVTLYLGEMFWLSTIKRERGLDYPFSHTVTLQLQTTF